MRGRQAVGGQDPEARRDLPRPFATRAVRLSRSFMPVAISVRRSERPSRSTTSTKAASPRVAPTIDLVRDEFVEEVHQRAEIDHHLLREPVTLEQAAAAVDPRAGGRAGLDDQRLAATLEKILGDPRAHRLHDPAASMSFSCIRAAVLVGLVDGEAESRGGDGPTEPQRLRRLEEAQPDRHHLGAEGPAELGGHRTVQLHREIGEPSRQQLHGTGEAGVLGVLDPVQPAPPRERSRKTWTSSAPGPSERRDSPETAAGLWGAARAADEDRARATSWRDVARIVGEVDRWEETPVRTGDGPRPTPAA